MNPAVSRDLKSDARRIVVASLLAPTLVINVKIDKLGAHHRILTVLGPAAPVADSDKGLKCRWLGSSIPRPARRGGAAVVRVRLLENRCIGRAGVALVQLAAALPLVVLDRDTAAFNKILAKKPTRLLTLDSVRDAGSHNRGLIVLRAAASFSKLAPVRVELSRGVECSAFSAFSSTHSSAGPVGDGSTELERGGEGRRDDARKSNGSKCRGGASHDR